jgi:hypothetical protein
MLKRRNFPRLYFLSNEDLMQMVSNASDEHLVQKDLVKLFPGISRLEFSLDPIERKVAPRALTARQKAQAEKDEKAKLKNRKKGDEIVKEEAAKPVVATFPQICGIINLQGEAISIAKHFQVVLENTIDVWCYALENAMKDSVSHFAHQAF